MLALVYITSPPPPPAFLSYRIHTIYLCSFFFILYRFSLRLNIMSWFGRRSTESIYDHLASDHSVRYYLTPKRGASTSDDTNSRSDPKPKQKAAAKPSPKETRGKGSTTSRPPAPKRKPPSSTVTTTPIKAANGARLNLDAKKKPVPPTPKRSAVTKDNFV